MRTLHKVNKTMTTFLVNCYIIPLNSKKKCLFLLVIFGGGSASWEGNIFSTLFGDALGVYRSVVQDFRNIYCLSWLKLMFSFVFS